MTTLEFFIDKMLPHIGYPIEVPNVTRESLAEWLTPLGFKTGVEVGVAAGEYLEVLCKANPTMKFYGVDPWVPYKGYADYQKNSTFGKLFSQMEERMKPYSNYTIVKKFSVDAAVDFQDNSLDFVYIDANHSDPFVTQDITEWYKKVRPGGIIAGHDYTQPYRHQYNVKSAVQRFITINKITTAFVLGTEAKDNGLLRDYVRSWVIIKPLI